ncbi:hypothetical protein EN817_03770 [Mesorhizobium sp. M3A.F.Ca.ET.174.01.1.1]|uniref:hypothetical protein n=1 Tax=unclassified Mesorhizobium TaxID=325217 RepID=UPI0010934160|nr:MULTISPECIES: hypothetical protein [unclassified Mesorhizobium]TGS89469.1 hypothetical protein EN818_03770 [Mesorhizobium sp. M3A.F.Ca.ET.175.01.1.1]TGT31242.1 hypothetical protein EN817_03770 [Mesorhizobium sp. M3A.F.Ca.ET.174.01.1.1]
MKKAAQEIDPAVRFTNSDDFLDRREDNPHLAIMIIGAWAKGRYQGDGVYAGGSEWHKKDRYNVKMLDTTDGGARQFSVIPVGEMDRTKWMTLPEPRFEAFMGEKVGAS